MDTTALQLETTTKVPTEWLRLDHLNPRLFGQAGRSTEEEIIARLYRSAELNELLQSISTNGYLDIEPLVVMKDPDSSALIVLEGNRRLATLRLLREPELVHRIWASEKLKIKIPSVENESIRATFDQISVYLVASRERARAFLGFKHINGPAKWDAYAKARFAAEWYRAEQANGVSLEDIAQAIGDRHDTIKRMVSAIYVLEQASREGIFDIEDRNIRKFNFSHLYTALARSQYMKYLGLDSTWAGYDPKPNPVSQERLGKLRKILTWIYGSKRDDILPVVQKQNPDIKRLGEVIVHAQGHHVLDAWSDLNAAYKSIEPVDQQFTTSLIQARDNIRDAAGSLRAYDGRDKSLLDIAEDVKETAETVCLSMTKKRRDASIKTS